MPKSTSKRGFASMDSDRQREIASKGGKASGGNFKNDPERAAKAGKIGGKSSRVTKKRKRTTSTPS